MEPRILHKRLLAMGVGLLVALGVVAATFVVLPPQAAHEEDVDYGYVYSGAKSSSVDFVTANLGEDSLLVLGSSEFSTPARLVQQVPAEVFGTQNYGVRAMLVGEAFDQCLWDTLALGALHTGGIPQNKVVLIIGLGMFTDGGLDASTFSARFSYTLCQAFFQNESIPTQVREQVYQRLLEQGVDEATLRSCSPQDPLDAIDGFVLGAMDDLKLRSELNAVRSKGIPLAQGDVQVPNWEDLRSQALLDAQRMSTTNDWGVEDAFYTEQLSPALDGLKGARAAETYTSTPEYDDLDLFLTTCDACGIEPLIVIEPVLGPYYDHIGISQQTRNAAYDRIREVVGRHGNARLADFSNREYEQYFLYDIVHFGWTGWVDAQEAIYEFAKEGE